MRTAREIFIRAAEVGNEDYRLSELLEYTEDNAQDFALSKAVKSFEEDWNEAFAERDDRIKEIEGCITELLFCLGYRIGCDCDTCKEKPELYKKAEQLIQQKQ